MICELVALICCCCPVAVTVEYQNLELTVASMILDDGSLAALAALNAWFLTEAKPICQEASASAIGPVLSECSGLSEDRFKGCPCWRS